MARQGRAVPTEPEEVRQAGAEPDHDPDQPSRRQVVRTGLKLAFTAPVLTTFFANQALAAASNTSCYAALHACPGAEPCCAPLNCVGNICQ